MGNANDLFASCNAAEDDSKHQQAEVLPQTRQDPRVTQPPMQNGRPPPGPPPGQGPPSGPPLGQGPPLPPPQAQNGYPPHGQPPMQNGEPPPPPPPPQTQHVRQPAQQAQQHNQFAGAEPQAVGAGAPADTYGPVSDDKEQMDPQQQQQLAKRHRSCATCAGIQSVNDICEDFDGDSTSKVRDPASRQAPMSSDRPSRPDHGAIVGTVGNESPPSAFEPTLKAMQADPPQGYSYPQNEQLTQEKLGKVRRLADGIDFYSNAGPNFTFQYHVHNRKMANLEFTTSLEGSQNMGWQGEQAMAKTVKVPPQEIKGIGTAAPLSAGAQSSLKLNFSFRLTPMDAAEFKPIKDQNTALISQNAQKMQQAGITASKMDMNAAKIMDACRKAGSSFLDLEFLPGDSALYEPGQAPKQPPPVIWLRPKDFLKDELAKTGGKALIYSDGIRASDIKQGALGDCWFLASLAALTEFHCTIETLLQKSETNDEGVYEVVCWKNGRYTSIIVDDWFPCNPATNKPVYSHTHGNELWVIILEKAWAKLHGSYQRIEAGIPYQCLMDLVCEPGLSCPFEYHKEEIASGAYFKMLKQFDDEGYLMAASTPGKDEMTKSLGGLPSGGIVPGHAYTVKAVKEYQGQRLVQLRNPWGKFEWDGDWSDQSKRWDSAAQQALNYTPNKDDGLFWMTDKDFFAHYSDVQAAHCRANSGASWTINNEQIMINGGDGYFVGGVQFLVDQPCEGFVTLWQLDERIRTSPKYSRLPFSIYGPLEEDASHPKEVMRSPPWKRREMVRPVTFKTGRYFMCVWNLDGKTAQEVPAVVMFHLAGSSAGAAPTSTQPTPQQQTDAASKGLLVQTQAIEPTETVAKVAAVCSAISSEGSKSNDYGDVVATSNWLPDGSFGIALTNKTHKNLQVTLNFTGSVGVTLVRRSDFQAPPNKKAGEMVTLVVLAPGQQNALGAELRPEPEAKDVNVTYTLATRG